MEKDIRGRMQRKKEKLKRKRRIKIFLIICISISVVFLVNSHKDNEEQNAIEENKTISEQIDILPVIEENDIKKEKIDDWKIKLANYENILPEDFTVELANIDETRKFDARAIEELNQMMSEIKKDGITNIWIQSSYRSVKEQTDLYNQHINKYIKQGKTLEEAEDLTLQYLNKPGGSDHNLGLAVDFNYVDNTFENTKAFKWLTENAEEYGFILRYPKGKQDITQIAYESWHWRYVGKEHAQKINELNMCLEEYVEYLENNKQDV